MKSFATARNSVMLVLIAIAVMISTTLSAQESQTEDGQTVHVVQPGDNLYRIALRYGVTVAELAEANQIADTSRINRGQSLVIPGVFAPTGAEVYNPLVAGTPVIHVVARGDTLTTIARQYSVPADQILRANNIANPNLIYRGQSLTIWTTTTAADVAPEAPAAEPAPVASTTVPYVVQRGEHLSQIAQRYGMSWITLAQMNGISDANRVYAGQVIQVPQLAGNQPQSQGPGSTITKGKQIIVVLSEQKTYAYEDGQLIYSTIVSTGLPDTPTVTGDYAIYYRLRSQTMTGPGYSLPNVEWVQYFYQGYGLHGTYWHNNFGRPMSHGCVNMTNAAAQWFYEWADYGTPVNVRY